MPAGNMPTVLYVGKSTTVTLELLQELLTWSLEPFVQGRHSSLITLYGVVKKHPELVSRASKPQLPSEPELDGCSHTLSGT